MSRKFDRKAQIQNATRMVLGQVLPQLIRPRPRFLALKLARLFLAALFWPTGTWAALTRMVLRPPKR